MQDAVLEPAVMYLVLLLLTAEFGMAVVGYGRHHTQKCARFIQSRIAGAGQ